MDRALAPWPRVSLISRLTSPPDESPAMMAQKRQQRSGWIFRVAPDRYALAALGREGLVVRRIVDQPGDRRALAHQPDRDGEVRNAVQEVGGAVERIDHPGVGLVAALAVATFLAEKAIARPRLQQLGAQDVFGAVIGGGDEVGRAFERDLQVCDLAEVALEAAPGLARGGDHHVEQGGLGGQEGLRAPW